MKIILAGFVLSFIGSLPPGLINLSVAQTAMQKNLKAAWVVALGASVSEFFQALLAVLFAAWFLSHPGIARAFEWATIPIFLGLSIWLFFFAKSPATTTPAQTSSKNNFLKGLIVSAFNLLAVPYWVFYCGWLRMEGWLQGAWWEALLLAIGVSAGTFALLVGYAYLGKWVMHRSTAAAAWANKVVAAIFLGLALKLFFK